MCKKTYLSRSNLAFPDRRSMLKGSAAALALLGMPAHADDADAGADAEDPGTPFDFDLLTERMREAATSEYAPPAPLGSAARSLDYDEYRLIQFRQDASRTVSEDGEVILQVYHPGWLFETPVQIHEVVDGHAQPIAFSWDDFEYRNGVREGLGDAADFPGVAGFRLNMPLNAAHRFDEVVSFLGASYFRALGRGNVYGLSARGLAINTAIGGEEEFPTFTEFWIERRAGDAQAITFYAALDSPSVTGAFRFSLMPGENTVLDVEQRLFFRNAVAQLGIAPLTSMFLFGPNDPGPFHDFRARVHDSEALVVASDAHAFVRPLTNPDTLANSYIGVANPTAFGLVQRNRTFDAYLDSHASYEARPSLIVEPLGEWGNGAVRLIEIPTEVESNDNIVAFWIARDPVAAGDERQFSYRLHWGLTPDIPGQDGARVVRTLAGFGGVAGIAPERDRQKFVIDFDAATMPPLEHDSVVEPRVTATDGEIVEAVLERLETLDLWRLVVEFRADADIAVSELSAALMVDDTRVSETWLYQWQMT